ncbi:MAG TPA: hypothetical protein PK893_07985 [Candidatus Competibacteraceae bacterium]|nr:hypothetical protein [Candidatus Competibacteraceae bacterium]
MQKLKEQILLGSDSLNGVRETGGFGQPLHALYPQIRAVLAGELGPEAADLLAEPVVDRASNRIDWYSEGDPDLKPVVLSDLTEEQRRPILAQIEERLGRGRELAERYAASSESHRIQLGAMLKAVLHTPAATEVFLVDERPVIIRWGFALDRPWETLAGSVHRPAPSPTPMATPGDVVIPEIPTPELTTEPTPAPAIEALHSSSTLAEPPPLPVAPPESHASPVQSEPPLLPPAPPESSPEPSQPQQPAEPSTPPPAGAKAVEPPLSSSPPASPSDATVLDRSERTPMADSMPVSSLRYVVVGSIYFWSVVALALALLLGAVWWSQTHKPPSATVGSMAQPPVSASRSLALSQAQRTEAELRARLEALRSQLVNRRQDRCPLPDHADAAAPAVREPGDPRSFASRSAVAVTGGGSASVLAPPSGAGDADRAPVSATTSAAEPVAPSVAPAPPAASGAGSDRAGPATPRADRAEPATPRAPASPATSAQTGDRPATPRAPATPVTPATSAQTGDRPAHTTSSTPSREPSVAESPSSTLEEALTTPNTLSPAKPSRSALPAEPPVRAEPTPEESREFKDRLLEARAATGETTATLLWNTHGDLDLVVRCPTGQQLDYQHPTECSGTLDIDANSTRASLSDRPVENVFWPAGKALPGVYEIAVRYIPRKDEQNPQATPFQVRLMRGGQETVFKGVVQPHALIPVTTFTVER